MAKVSAFEKNAKRARLIKRDSAKRAALKEIIMDKNTSDDDRMQAVMKFQKLNRNGASVRYRNRCGVTGRPRGNYRLFNLSRIEFRELASSGMIPGVVKSSW